MRIALLSAALAASAVATGPARAQTPVGVQPQIREARNPRARDWQQYRRYDHDRYEDGQRGYFAERYYRDARYYQERRLDRNDRIYRGGDGRYYCRRGDGTTGLIIGGLAGATLGTAIPRGGSRLLGTLTGAEISRSIDRGAVRCR